MLDPQYLRWREEQGEPSIFNSPIAMATGARAHRREGTNIRERSTRNGD